MLKQLIIDPVKNFQSVQLVRQVSLFLGTIIIAQSALNIEDIGHFEWLVYLGYSTSYFWAAGFLQGLLAGDSEADQPYSSGFLWNIFYLFLIGSGLVLLVFLLIGFFQGQQSLIIPSVYYSVFGFWMFFQVAGMMLPYLLYLRKANSALLFFNAFYFIGYSGCFLILFMVQADMMYLLWSMVIFGFIQFIWTIKQLLSYGKYTVYIRELVLLLRRIMPLCGYALMGGLAVVFDGWLVQFLHSDAEVFAIFRYGAREFPLAIALTAALSNAMIPAINENTKTGIADLKTRALRLTHMLGSVMIIMMIFSEYVFSWVYGLRFLESVILFDTMLLLFISRLIFPQTILLSYGQNAFLFRVSFIELMINVLLSIALYFVLGIMGIVLATVIAFSFEKWVFVRFLYRKFHISLSDYTSIGWWLMYSVLLVLIYLTKYLVL